MIEVPLDAQAARRCGELLAMAQTNDIADAAVVLLANTATNVLYKLCPSPAAAPPNARRS
jgi:hypothetical protein